MDCKNLVSEDYQFYARRMDEIFEDVFSPEKIAEYKKTMSPEEFDSFRKEHIKKVLSEELRNMAIKAREFNGKKSDMVTNIMNANFNREATNSHMEVMDFVTGFNTQLKKGTIASDGISARLNAKAIISVEGKKMNVINHLKDDTGDFVEGLVTSARSKNEITRTAQDVMGNEIEKGLKELELNTGIKTPKKEVFVLSNIINRQAIEERFKTQITRSEKLLGKSKTLTTDKLKEITVKMEKEINDVLKKHINGAEDLKRATDVMLDLFGLADGFNVEKIKTGKGLFSRAEKFQRIMDNYGLSNEAMLEIASLGNTDGNFALSNVTKKLKENYKRAYSFGNNGEELIKEVIADLKKGKAGDLRFKTEKEKERAFSTLEKIMDGMKGGNDRPDTLGVRLVDAVANLASAGKVPLIGTQAVIDPLVNLSSSAFTLNKGQGKMSTAIEGLTSMFNKELLGDLRSLPIGDIMAVSEALEKGMLNGLFMGGNLENAYSKVDDGLIKRMSNISYENLSYLRQVEDFTKNTAMNMGKVVADNTFSNYSFDDVLAGKSSRAMARMLGNSGLDKNGYNMIKNLTGAGKEYEGTRRLIEKGTDYFMANREELTINADNLDIRALLEYNSKNNAIKTGYGFDDSGLMPKADVKKLMTDTLTTLKNTGALQRVKAFEDNMQTIIDDVAISLDKSGKLNINFNKDSFIVESGLDKFVTGDITKHYKGSVKNTMQNTPRKIIESLKLNPTESNPIVKEYNDFVRSAKPKEIKSIATNKSRTAVSGYENLLSELQDYNAPSEIKELSKATDFMSVDGNMNSLQYASARIGNFFKKTGVATMLNMVEKAKKSKGMADSWKDGGALELAQTGLAQSVIGTVAGTLNNYIYAIANEYLANNPKERESLDKQFRKKPVNFLIDNAQEGMYMSLGWYQTGLSKSVGKAGTGAVRVMSGDLEGAKSSFRSASKGFYGNRASETVAESILSIFE